MTWIIFLTLMSNRDSMCPNIGHIFSQKYIVGFVSNKISFNFKAIFSDGQDHLCTAIVNLAGKVIVILRFKYKFDIASAWEQELPR